jgi:hypothetical protein
MAPWGTTGMHGKITFRRVMLATITAACVVLMLACLTSVASACMGPHTRVFPTCQIAGPSPDERVAVVYAYGGSALSSVSLGDDGLITEVVDVVVGRADKPHYIALSSGKPVIWRFSGETDSISRVVVLGSQIKGAARAGITGVPRERVRFVASDLDALRRVPITSCTSLYAACEASTYFDIAKADRMVVAGTTPARRHAVDQFVAHDQAGTIHIPATDDRPSMLATAHGRHEAVSGMAFDETSASHERGIAYLTPGDVVAPDAVKPYDVLPSWAGINQLVADGTLVPPSSERFKGAYAKWDEAVSAPLRNRLDPDFRMSHKVDFLITKATRIPASVSDTAFLVDEGVEAPVTTGMSFTSCIFFADRRPFARTRPEDIDPRCDRDGGSLGMPDRERKLLSIRDARERSGTGEKILSALRGHEAANTDTRPLAERCRLASIPDDAYFAAVAISEGPAWRAGAQDQSRRRVDIVVKRPGRVALYLEMFGGRTDWHIAAAPGTEVVALVIGSLHSWWGGAGDQVHGVPASAVVELRQRSCPLPRRDAHVGGPAAPLLDESLKVLVGRGLDRLVREINDGSWPQASDASAHVSFVVE